MVYRIFELECRQSRNSKRLEEVGHRVTVMWYREVRGILSWGFVRLASSCLSEELFFELCLCGLSVAVSRESWLRGGVVRRGLLGQ
ncbi:hypothetical protein PAXRUDRAFT_832684 [Paxillus rubicundulus Ve08.2h10]|uniref:Unplaced genomic scaffold scaffold_928, whole genome shotgun sequence n=1 Tax=Paxillus rubicundulus Ve08.2h10 TaxID=930991 RepID=A0A0D0DJ82_9AGAM|nr:hypothetical protein PAXRUDRAFT_832684 [Paxillus rubicundulus Ve08.2h10]